MGTEGYAGWIADVRSDGLGFLERVGRGVHQDVVGSGIGDPQVALRIDRKSPGQKEWTGSGGGSSKSGKQQQVYCDMGGFLQ